MVLRYIWLKLKTKDEFFSRSRKATQIRPITVGQTHVSRRHGGPKGLPKIPPHITPLSRSGAQVGHIFAQDYSASLSESYGRDRRCFSSLVLRTQRHRSTCEVSDKNITPKLPIETHRCNQTKFSVVTHAFDEDSSLFSSKTCGELLELTRITTVCFFMQVWSNSLSRVAQVAQQKRHPKSVAYLRITASLELTSQLNRCGNVRLGFFI